MNPWTSMADRMPISSPVKTSRRVCPSNSTNRFRKAVVFEKLVNHLIDDSRLNAGTRRTLCASNITTMEG